MKETANTEMLAAITCQRDMVDGITLAVPPASKERPEKAATDPGVEAF